VNFVNFFLSPLGYYLHPFSVQEPWDRLCVFFLQNLTEFGLQRRSFRSRAHYFLPSAHGGRRHRIPL